MGQVPTDIRALFISLFRISTNKPREKYNQADTLPYDTVEHINAISNVANDLREISELTGRPYTP